MFSYFLQLSNTMSASVHIFTFNKDKQLKDTYRQRHYLYFSIMNGGRGQFMISSDQKQNLQ